MPLFQALSSLFVTMHRKKIPCTCDPTCKSDAACRQKRSKAKSWRATPRRRRHTSQNVRKPRKDMGGRRKDSNTLPASSECNDNLADMSDGASSLSSFASITTGSSSGSGSDSVSDNETSSSYSCSEQDNFVTKYHDLFCDQGGGGGGVRAGPPPRYIHPWCVLLGVDSLRGGLAEGNRISVRHYSSAALFGLVGAPSCWRTPE